MTSSNTNIEQVSTALAQFDRVAAGIAALKEQFGGVVYDCRTADGDDAARAARAAIREPRYEVEKVRKGAKAPLLALGKQIDDEAKRITAELLAIEEPIDQQIKAEEARREAERQARIKAEAERVAAIRQRIDTIRSWPALYAGKPSALIEQQINVASSYTIDESFAEFGEEAQRVLSESLDRLRTAHDNSLAHEAEKARLEQERAELARLRAEAEARQAEERRAREAAEREAADRRKAEEDDLRAKREAIAAEDKRLAEERAALERARTAATVATPATPDPDPPPKAPAAAARVPPTPEQIVAVLMEHFGATQAEVLSWLRAFNRRKAA